MLATADKIALLAGYLSEDSQKALEMKSRHLLLNFKQEELNRLLQETEARTEESRRLRDRIKAAAVDVIDFLKRARGLTLDVKRSEEVVAAVREGDAAKAVSLAGYPAVSTPATTPPKGVASLPAPTVATELQKASDLVTAASLEANTANFVPRDRVLAKDPALPKTSDALASFLLSRIFAEIERGSIAAAIDDALDSLQLAGAATAGRDYWANVALTVLAALPSTLSDEPNWPGKTARALAESIKNLDPNTLANYFAVLLTQARFDEAISTRFAYPEVGPFADIVSSSPGCKSGCVSKRV